MTTYKDKLASSGLTPVDGKALGIELLSKQQFAKLFPDSKPPVKAFKLQYFDIKGRPRKKIFRVRVLEAQRKAFGAESSMRYMQAKGTPPAAYFPRPQDWKSIAVNAATSIVITEGELKAACACKHGINCIGLGGVWSWRSKDKGWALLPELEAIEWSGRDVVICFDADAASNPQVAAAAAALCRELRSRGAIAAIAELPPVNGDPKTGLDDFIVAKGIDPLKKILGDAPDDELALALWEYNGRYAYIKGPDVLFDTIDDLQLSPSRAVNFALANEKVHKLAGDKMVEVPVIKEWFTWPQRRTMKSFTYKPGQPHIIGDEYNQWSGWGVEEKEGDVSPWHALLDYILGDCTPEERQWFERWCAYPIQHPGAKMQTACCMWSVAQGVGKSFTALILGDLYGTNFSEIPQDEFADKYTAWGVGKQLVLVDDVSTITKTEARDYAARLKTLVTQQSFKVNIKYVANYTLPDCINYMLTSNSPDALLIDEQDRRFDVVHCPEQAQSKSWYDNLDQWRKGDGPSALLYYLRRLGLGKQDVNTRPPVNEAKKNMGRFSRADHEQWAIDLRDCPEDVLVYDAHAMTGDIYTPRELLDIYLRASGAKWLGANTFGVALTRAGFEPRPVKVKGSTKRLYAVRNRAKWAKKAATVWATHYMQHNGGMK